MSRLWQEIQRDKHIFPYVQLKVVMDGHTSEICSPLHDLIFEVDDPVLAYYFPPNHFNCRTTAIKLRNGKPSENFTLPDIPKEFRNNVGMCPGSYQKKLSANNDTPDAPERKACGELFTQENAYIKNTPEEAIKEFERFQRREKDKELKEWSIENIPEGGLIQDDFIINRKSIKNIYSHFTNLDLKEIVKDIRNILKEMEFLESANLNPNSHNYEKKKASGIVGYEYYQFYWKGLHFRMNIEKFKDGTKKPYSVNQIIKKEN